jgi:hypothetical protein
MAAAAIAAPDGAGAREAVRGFFTVVDRRPAQACRTYLTPAARRQWESFESLPCRWKTTNVEESDRRRFFVVARPSRRVARVAGQLVDLHPCGELGHRYVHTVVHRGRRWRIARFGSLECLDRR